MPTYRVNAPMLIPRRDNIVDWNSHCSVTHPKGRMSTGDVDQGTPISRLCGFNDANPGRLAFPVSRGRKDNHEPR